MTLERNSVLNLKTSQNFNSIIIEELVNIPKINLRGNINDKEFNRNTGIILNALLPIESNIRIINNDLQIIWLSPDEWLIQFDTQDKFKEVLKKLQSQLNPQNTSTTDISDNKTIIKIRGDNLYKLLAKFMIINLDEALKLDSSVAQTIFSKIPILIVRQHKNNNEPCVDIHVNRSHTNYLYNLLVDGTKNFDF